MPTAARATALPVHVLVPSSRFVRPFPFFARMMVLDVDSSALLEAEAHLFGRLARNASQVRGRQTRERGRLTQSSSQARCDRAGAHLIPRTGARASRRQASRSPPIHPNGRRRPAKLPDKNSREVVEPFGVSECTILPLTLPPLNGDPIYSYSRTATVLYGLGSRRAPPRKPAHSYTT